MARIVCQRERTLYECACCGCEITPFQASGWRVCGGCWDECGWRERDAKGMPMLAVRQARGDK